MRDIKVKFFRVEGVFSGRGMKPRGHVPPVAGGEFYFATRLPASRIKRTSIRGIGRNAKIGKVITVDSFTGDIYGKRFYSKRWRKMRKDRVIPLQNGFYEYYLKRRK